MLNSSGCARESAQVAAVCVELVVEQIERTEVLRPVGASERIEALDAVRGFALLGIFLVNIQFFSAPMGEMFSAAPPEGVSRLDAVAHYAVNVLAAGKFYPLFSMLFGMGMAMQLIRARRAGRGLAGFYRRRLVVLGAIGLGHALLLWYGDILFVYAVAGAAMMLLIGLKARTLAALGAGLVLISAVMAGGLTALGALAEEPNGQVTAEGTTGEPSPGGEASAGDGASGGEVRTGPSPAEDPPEADRGEFERFWGTLMAGELQGGPDDPLWMEAERAAHAEGPLRDLLIIRSLNWASMIVFWQILSGGFLHVLAMFCFGAALMKVEFFHAHRRGLRVRLLVLGTLIGLPLGAVAAFWPVADERVIPAKVGAALAMVIGGPFLSVAYLAGIALFVEGRPGALAARGLANLGRLALTNYLMQTVLATTIFYYWGFGLFGKVSAAESVGVVLAIFAFQLVVSVLWLRVFRIGPAEWVWRSLTYLRAQPVLRERAAGRRAPGR